LPQPLTRTAALARCGVQQFRLHFVAAFFGHVESVLRLAFIREQPTLAIQQNRIDRDLERLPKRLTLNVLQVRIIGIAECEDRLVGAQSAFRCSEQFIECSRQHGTRATGQTDRGRGQLRMERVPEGEAEP
jgi:hypothetical protein